MDEPLEPPPQRRVLLDCEVSAPDGSRTSFAGFRAISSAAALVSSEPDEAPVATSSWSDPATQEDDAHEERLTASPRTRTARSHFDEHLASRGDHRGVEMVGDRPR